MKDFLCHDFKTPRTDMSRRLPSSMRIVPVLFYIIAGVSGFFAYKDYNDFKQAEFERADAESKQGDLDAQKTKAEEEVIKLQEERAKAEALAKWIEGTRPVQPVSVAVARAMSQETTITDLTVERQIDVPSQMNISIRMANASLNEIEAINAALGRLSYRVYSPQQQKQGDQIEFRAVIKWQE